MIYAVKQFLYADHLHVMYSDGTVKIYDIVKLGCEWFNMSNDVFFDVYGFNFNPHSYPGLYEQCRQRVFGGNR